MLNLAPQAEQQTDTANRVITAALTIFVVATVLLWVGNLAKQSTRESL